MTLVPASSHGGGGAAGVAAGTLTQTGAGSPIGVVAPAGVGSLYEDTTNGALYVGTGAGNTAWINVGGKGDGTTPTGIIQRNGAIIVTGSGIVGGGVELQDLLAWNGSGNGLAWQCSGVDGQQTLDVILGSAGQFITHFHADGTIEFPAGIRTGEPTVSGALATVQLVSGVAAVVASVRDVETVTPVTFNPGAATIATCTVALSPDNATYSTLGVETEPAGVALDGTIHLVKVRVPAGWYLKLTVSATAVLGLTTYY